MAETTETKELITSKYAALAVSQKELGETIRENLGGEKLQTSDFTRVRTPAGGGTTWEVPSLEGTEAVKELTGIIIHSNYQRAYWAGEFEGAGTQPDCYSVDAKVGVGEPGGECDTCPFAEFESAKNGKGQACKITRRVFLLTEDSLLPTLLVVPPASLKNLKQYLLSLAARAIPMTAVITGLKLQKEQNAAGISYARIVPRMVERLDAEAAAKVRAYADSMQRVLSVTTVDSVAAETAGAA